MVISEIPRMDKNAKDMGNISHPFLEHILQIVGDLLSTNWIMMIVADIKNPDTIFLTQKHFRKSGVVWQLKEEKLGMPLAKKISYQITLNQNRTQYFIIRTGDKLWSQIEPVLKNAPYIIEQMKNKNFSPCVVLFPEELNKPRLSLMIFNEFRSETLIANPEHCLQISKIIDAAIAYEHERYEEKRKFNAYTERLEGMRNIGITLTLEHDERKLVESIVRLSMILTKADRGGFYVFRQYENILELLYKLGPFPERVFLRKGEGLSGRVLETGKPMLVPDYKSWPGRAHEFDGLDIGASLAVPVRLGTEFLGVITNDSDKESFFSEEDIKLVESFAPHAAVALINTKIISELKILSQFNNTILQGLGGGIMELDLESNILYINREMEDMIGYSLDAMKGKNWREIIAPEWIERVNSEIERCLSSEKPRFYAEILNIERKRSNRDNVIVHLNPLMENGQIHGILGLFIPFEDSYSHLTSDLHDRVNFLRSGIISKCITDIKNLLPEDCNSDLVDKIQLLEKACFTLYDGLWNMMADLRIPILASDGLVAAINKYIERPPYNNFKISVEDNSELRFKPQIELSLFRIAQGAIQNSTKHAELDEITGFVKVKLEKDRARFTMTVEDNGKGYNVYATQKDKLKPFGLQEMEHWANGIPKSDFQIKSKYNKNRCTKVIISFPIGA